MASTINATTSGIVTIGDSVATLSLQTGGNTAVAIDTAQIVSLSKSLALLGSTSGSVTIAAPAVAGSTTITLPATSGTLLQSGTAVTVAQGGTGLTAGTSGGIPYYSGASAITSSAALTQYGVVYGGGAGNAPVATAAGTTGQFLGANTGGAPTWQTPAGGGSAATATTLGTVYSSDLGSGVGLGNGVLATQSGTTYNTAMGFGAFPGAAPFTGQRNTAIGTFSGNLLSSGSYNTLVGMYSGANITTGSNNVCVGRNAGISRPVTGSNNIQVGDNTNLTSDAADGQIVIGASLTAKGDNTAYIGGSSGAYNGQNSAAWLVASDQRLKKNIVDNNIGLNAIKSIQVRNFEYRLPEEVDSELSPDDAIIKSGVQLGVIAQELQAVLPDCVKQESTGVLSVNSDNLTWYTINAIKQLSAALDAANARIAALEAK